MTLLPEPRSLDLRDAISQMINLGETDPITITRKLAELRGGNWIAEQLAAHWEEIIAEIARQALGSQRRAAVESIGNLARKARGTHVAKRDVMLATVWVPGKMYVKIGDASPEDLRAAAEYRRRLAEGLVRHAEWCDDLAARMEAAGAKRGRDYKGRLPELPAPPLIGLEGGA